MGKCIKEYKYHRNRVICRLSVCGSGRKVEILEGTTTAEAVFTDPYEAELVFLSACGLELLPDCFRELCMFIRQETSSESSAE